MDKNICYVVERYKSVDSALFQLIRINLKFDEESNHSYSQELRASVDPILTWLYQKDYENEEGYIIYSEFYDQDGNLTETVYAEDLLKEKNK